jgi:rhodanese-related sulfurtransferase
MTSPTGITVAKFARLVGLPGAPVLADVRTDQEHKSDPRLIPTAQRHPSIGVAGWCTRYAGNPIVVVCQSGGTPSQTVAVTLWESEADMRAFWDSKKREEAMALLRPFFLNQFTVTQCEVRSVHHE